MTDFDKFYEATKSVLEPNHKQSMIRVELFKIIFDSKKHLSVEELESEYKRIYKTNVSKTAIYSFIKLLLDVGLIDFVEENGVKKYEFTLKSNHHDHLICVNCGKIVEFYDKDLEEIQENICKSAGFISLSHKFIMYGVCKNCQALSFNHKQKTE